MKRTGSLDGLIEPVQGSLRRQSILAVGQNLIWPMQAALVAIAIGQVLSGAPSLGVVATTVVGYVGLGLLRAVLSAMADRLAQETAEIIVSGLRRQIVTREAARAGFVPGQGPGALAALATEKVAALTPWLTRYTPARARSTVVPLVILGLAFAFSWAAGLILLITGPLIPVFMALVGFAAKDASARQMAQIGSLNDLFVDRLSALVDIRVLGAARTVETGFVQLAADLRQRTMAVLRLAFLSSAVLELFAAIGVAMMAVYVGFSLLGQIEFGTWSGAPLSPEVGLFLLLLAPEFYQPLRDLASAWHDKAAAEAVADEYKSWSEAETIERIGAGAQVAPLPGPVSVRLINCISQHGVRLPHLVIAPGEAVALTGKSGAGKSTALRLIAGLERPSAGEVEVAGHALDGSVADAWRARIGFMPQSARFLSTSLKGNITLGRPGDPSRAITAAMAGGIVERLPGGLNTPLGESGGGLSGGEARRMMLARAIHGCPDLLLVDEPTADLDAETARLVIEGLIAEHQRGATLIVATHDPALVARLSRVVAIGDAG